MKEFPHAFTAQITQGLALVPEDSKRGEFLADCVGFRPTDLGLALQDPVRAITVASAEETETGVISFDFPPVRNTDVLQWDSYGNVHRIEGTTLYVSTLTGEDVAAFRLVAQYNYSPTLPALTGNFPFSCTFIWGHPDLAFTVQIEYYNLANAQLSAQGTGVNSPSVGQRFAYNIPLHIPAGTAYIRVTYLLETRNNGEYIPHSGDLVAVDATDLVIQGTTSDPGTGLYDEGLEGQLFVTPDEGIYGVFRNLETSNVSLYTIDAGMSTITTVETFDVDSLEQNTIPQFSNKANFESLGGSWYFGNQTGFIFNTYNKVYATDAFKSNGLCKWQNRLVFGGFTLSADHMASANWERLWDMYLLSYGPEQETSGYGRQVLDDSFIFWSTDGGGATQYGMLLEGMILGIVPQPSAVVTSMLPAALELLREGKLGFARVPGIGSIQGVAPVGESLLVAGTRGIALLTPTQVEGKQVAFSQRIVTKRGIRSPQAICAHGGRVLLVCDDFSLWEVGSEGSKMLGRLPLPEDSYDFVPQGIFPEYKNDGFYIHDNLYCYYLGGGKVSRTGVKITSAVVLPSGVYHYQRKSLLATPYVDMDSDLIYCMFKTNKFDMDLTALKTLRFARLTYAGYSWAQIRVHTWYTQGQSAPYSGSWIHCTPEGAVYLGVTGLYFQIEVRLVTDPNLADAKHVVTGLTGSWQLSDNRYLRGMYSNAAQIAATPD